VNRVEGEYRDSMLTSGESTPSRSSHSDSPDRPILYESDGRRPAAAINVITAHDGFHPLLDLVSYNDKHTRPKSRGQSATGRRQTGHGTAAPRVPQIPRSTRSCRASTPLLATLILSQGVRDACRRRRIRPLQGGNNTPGCHDSESPWFDWSERDEALRTFTRRLIDLRLSEPVFPRRDFLRCDEVVGSGLPDVVWFGWRRRDDDGADWERTDAHALGCSSTRRIPTTIVRGNTLVARLLPAAVQSHHEPLPFPSSAELGETWTTVLGSDRLATIPTPRHAGAEAAARGALHAVIPAARDLPRFDSRVGELGVPWRPRIGCSG